MNAAEIYITADCVIRGNNVISNGHVLYSQEGATAVEFFEGFYRHLAIDYPKFFKMDRLSKLGMLAAEVLARNGWQQRSYTPENVGIVLTNAQASLDADIRYYASVSNLPSPALFVYTLPNIVIGEISIRHGFKGENAFFVAGHFDPALLKFYAGELFRTTSTQACIAGWVDVIGESYEAMLVLLEKEAVPGSLPFTTEQLTKLYATDHGAINANA